ncbi:MAG TPA: guanylate kinase [Blastocatellia bacterium]|nr:guanylate kinase [Blastocatellia bacterium]
MSSEQRAAEPGNLIVVSAPSGAGKSTLVERALARLDRLRYSISCTTRRPRGAEKNGVDYYFLSPEEFLARRARGEFLESAEVHGFLYGTLKSEVERITASGDDVILDLDVQGAKQIRRQMPEAVTVFIMPPSRGVLEARLRLRNLNEPADLERRLRNAAAEVRTYQEFSYLIVNDDLERASAELETIITAERQRAKRKRVLAESIIETFGGEVFNA